MSDQPSSLMMRAIVQDTYGPPDSLEVGEIPRPESGDGELLVRVQAAGVDAGVWHATTGLPYLARLGLGLRKPKNRVPGLAFAGRVETVGAGVAGFAPGDEVYGTCGGSFAHYAVARPDKVAAKPANLTVAEAAAVPVSSVTALKAVRDAGRIQPGQRVLVTGAGGGVGTYAVQLAKAYGADVTGVCSAAKTDIVRSLGADEVIDYATTDFTRGREQYDLIIDIAGNRRVTDLRRVLTPRGTLVIVGGEGGGRWLGGFHRTLRAMLVSLFVRQRLRGLIAIDRAEDLKVVTQLIEAGKVTPAVDRTFPLNEAGRAVQYLHESRARGKIVITT